jgi:hypothetical protein
VSFVYSAILGHRRFREKRMNEFQYDRRTLMLMMAATALAAAQPAAAHWPSPALVSVDVYDRTDGTSLVVYPKDGRRYFVGSPGHEYAVRIRNNTGERVLAVTSVDGVNVVSGETAAPEQSGYVIDAYGSVEISGWRKSLERTAAFYFTDLGDSYAARTGRPRNVGVIGVAVFKEKQPPIVYRSFRDKVAADAPSARAESPAAAADAQSAPAQSAERERNDARGLTSKLGTGHGRSEASYAQRVEFERASSSPAETVAIQYDRRENLIAMGVLPSPRYAQRVPDPFPGMRFAPDPR